jgi:hypothetical protein
MSPDSTSSGRSPDPALEQVFTPTLAEMRGWQVLDTAVRSPGLLVYTRRAPASAQHYLVTDHGIVIALSTRKDVCEYLASRRGGQL